MKNTFEFDGFEDEASSDHILEAADLEADPDFYKTRFLSMSKQEVRKIIEKGSQLSIVIDTGNYSIGIGSDHHNMCSKMGIDMKNYFAGYAVMDRVTGKISVRDFTDCRPGTNLRSAPGLKNAIAERLQRDIFS